ncbi:MAG: hypothetical protein ACI38O_00030 [Fibrobacter intestinalis]|uniref:hypothetical protein n=1 Tax=Fibrobacter intestinalis TaxID=28122 RepID=UPI003F105AF2
MGKFTGEAALKTARSERLRLFRKSGRYEKDCGILASVEVYFSSGKANRMTQLAW